ncbi:MAG: FecR domain-containing protein [Proteobacteria bacterium]|nr:FecR domain-containing protein [Pseudomonadota bacterium]
MTERNEQRTTDEAAGWFVRINSDSASEADWAAFTAWLEADSTHRLAFDRVEDLDRELDALAAKPEEKVVAFNRRSGPAKITVRGPQAWIAGAGLLAAAALVAIFVMPRAPQAVTLATGTGETKSVDLADGTHIDINTKSKIILDHGVAGRHVILVGGEALFHVAKDPTRPFVVAVGDRAVRVVGTVFNVLRNEGAITVVVAQGKVAVSPLKRHSGARVQQTEFLTPGEGLVYDESNETLTRERVDPTHTLAWRDGYLVYDNAPLASVASDLNRYFSHRVAAEGKAERLRFSGVLKMDNEDAVLNRLTKLLPIGTSRNPDGTVTLRSPKNSD